MKTLLVVSRINVASAGSPNPQIASQWAAAQLVSDWVTPSGMTPIPLVTDIVGIWDCPERVDVRLVTAALFPLLFFPEYCRFADAVLLAFSARRSIVPISKRFEQPSSMCLQFQSASPFCR